MDELVISGPRVLPPCPWPCRADSWVLRASLRVRRAPGMHWSRRESGPFQAAPLTCFLPSYPGLPFLLQGVSSAGIVPSSSESDLVPSFFVLIWTHLETSLWTSTPFPPKSEPSGLQPPGGLSNWSSLASSSSWVMDPRFHLQRIYTLFKHPTGLLNSPPEEASSTTSMRLVADSVKLAWGHRQHWIPSFPSLCCCPAPSPTASCLGHCSDLLADPARSILSRHTFLSLSYAAGHPEHCSERRPCWLPLPTKVGLFSSGRKSSGPPPCPTISSWNGSRERALSP